MKRGNRSGKSLQLWIASQPAPAKPGSTIARELKRNSGERGRCDDPSPSTTAPSLHATGRSQNDSVSISSSAIRTHPGKKGGVENAIGRLRRSLPRKTDLHALPDDRIDGILTPYNHTPRKCLGFQTPAEAFINPLHFQCESTPVSSPGVTMLWLAGHVR
ncbi:hypothetical protein U1702_12465 [Sphingomonas sp. LT1P40]